MTHPVYVRDEDVFTHKPSAHVTEATSCRCITSSDKEYEEYDTSCICTQRIWHKEYEEYDKEYEEYDTSCICTQRIWQRIYTQRIWHILYMYVMRMCLQTTHPVYLKYPWTLKMTHPIYVRDEKVFTHKPCAHVKNDTSRVCETSIHRENDTSCMCMWWGCVYKRHILYV